ncbi:syntaxin-7-like [Glandiceps talaboti]
MNKGEFGSYGAIGETRGGGFDTGGGFGNPSGSSSSRYGQTGYQQLGDSELRELTEQCSNNIFKINTNASALEKTIRQIGSSTDSPALRNKIHNTQQTTNSIVGKTARLLKELTNLSRGATKQQKLQVDRLKSDFEGTVKGYSTVQKKVADKLRSCPAPQVQERRPPEGYGSHDGYDNYGNDRTQFMEEEDRRQERLAQLQEQDQVIDFDQGMMEEREDRIREIEADILDVNQIFKDLATLVYEQGELVDTIEANVEKAVDNVEQGNVQLVQASSYQKKARKKMCILLLILVIVGGVIAVIIVLSTKK